MRDVSKAIIALLLAAPLALGACSGGAKDQEKSASETTEAATDAAGNETLDPEAKDNIGEGFAADSEADAGASAGEAAEAAEEGDSAGETSSKPASSNVDDLASWGIKIAVPDGATAVLKGNEYYVYTEKGKSFPYVLVCVYNMDMSGEAFLKEFTDYMKEGHADLVVSEEPKSVKIGDKDCVKTVYEYAIEGHPARDTRVVVPANGRVYMFATKEIDELGLSAAKAFERVVKDAVIYKAK